MASALTLEQILKAVGATPGAISVRLLDASASGASAVATDDVITLTKTDIVPVLDAAGNVTGYRNLQNYDRVYLNDALAKDGKTISLQNNVAYYVLVESGATAFACSRPANRPCCTSSSSSSSRRRTGRP